MLSSLPSARPALLVVDDEEAIREMLAEFLSLEGYDVETAEHGMAALGVLETRLFDIVLTDLKMPKMGGIALLEQMRRHAPGTVGIIMTGFGTVESAIGAMKNGAYDYILKPFKLDEVLHVVGRAAHKRRMESENIRLRQAVSLYKVSEAIKSSLSLDQVLLTVVESSITEIDAEVVSVWLDDGEGGLIERERAQTEKPPTGARDFGELDAEAVSAALGEYERVLVHGADAHRFFTDADTPVRSFAAVPLKTPMRDMGFIAAMSTHPVKRFEEGSRKLLSIVASRAAAAIENAKLYQDLQDTFQQTIEGLASAVDKMDRYTAGHSKRVADYATHLARRLGLDAATIEIVHQSALMHDIGKIGCAMNLNKPDQLTDDEYEEFKLHPMHGRDILSPIAFLHPLIPGVHLHHERFDGRGYPLGLVKTDIPLIARLISVADAYDAMTCDRSYRRALPHEVAVAEIERCSGSQFDPDISGEFLEEIETLRAQSRDVGEQVPD